MSRALITESNLTGIANAIRTKLGVQNTYTPPQMAAAIESIPTGGITPTGTKNITQNGTHDVTQYASANVNVQPNLQSKTATQNGTVTPDQGYDGLSSVVVDVSGGGGDPVLPSAYQEVEYIEAYGDQYTIIPIKADLDEEVSIIASQSVEAGTSEECVCGDSSGGSAWEIYFENNNIIFYSEIHGTNISGITRDTPYTLTGNITARNTGSNMMLFRYRTSGNQYPFIGKILGLTLKTRTKNNKQFTWLKLIPCYQKSNGEIGFYDVIAGVFYTNLGSGSFGKGPNVT